MKAILLLCLVATVLATEYTLTKQTWAYTTNSDPDSNTFLYAVTTPNTKKDTGIVLYVENSDGSAAHDISVEILSHISGDSGLRKYGRMFEAVPSNKITAISIPGSYWIKNFYGTGSVSYQLQFNVTSVGAGLVSVYLDEVAPLSSTEYLTINESSPATTYKWAYGMSTNLVEGSVVTLGLKMSEQLEHFYLRTTVSLLTAGLGRWSAAKLTNPSTDAWFDSDDTFPATGSIQQAVVRTCLSGSSCTLVDGDTYFLMMTVRDLKEVTPADQFNVDFLALNGAAGVTISALLLLAMIALALL